jgi:hypothetical protein
MRTLACLIGLSIAFAAPAGAQIVYPPVVTPAPGNSVTTGVVTIPDNPALAREIAPPVPRAPMPYQLPNWGGPVLPQGDYACAGRRSIRPC